MLFNVFSTWESFAAASVVFLCFSILSEAFSIVFPPLRFENYWQDTTNKYTFKIAIGIGDEKGKSRKKKANEHE